MHVNQVYDKFVAKSDKPVKTYSLSIQQNWHCANKGCVDQWGLVQTGLMAICETDNDMWKNSFRACNLDPITRLDSKQWCEKIQ